MEARAPGCRFGLKGCEETFVCRHDVNVASQVSEAEIRSRTWQKWTFFRSAPQARKIYMLWQPIVK